MTPGTEWEEGARKLRRILGDGLRLDEPMSKHTTIGVGGPARMLATPKSVKQVAGIVRVLSGAGIDWVTVGKGSNLIVRDGGYDGAIIKMGTYLSRVTVNKRTVRAEGGASFARLSRRMTKEGRAGLEWGIGIPGTVGGAVRMNAGAFGGDIEKNLRRIRLVDARGNVSTVAARDIVFTYRHTNLPERSIVVSATFDCPPGDIDREAYERSLGRKKTQPIDERTFGSTFVNPPEGFAAEMIEGCGLKGARRGGAMISAKHANFIVNPDGSATAADVEWLIRRMRSEVRKKYGVTLKTEVVIIGNR